MSATTDPPRSRAHHLGQMSRTGLITIYQAQHPHDRYETGLMDRDRLIATILDVEGPLRDQPSSPGPAKSPPALVRPGAARPPR